MYSVHQFQLFLSNVYLHKPTVTILHLSSVWFITKILMQWFPSSVAIQTVLLMALQSKVLYCAFCTPFGKLHMYSLLLTRCCINQLGGLSHTQLRTVSSFCMECGGGRGFASTVYDESATTASSKTLITLHWLPVLMFRTLRIHISARLLRLRCLLDFHLQNMQIWFMRTVFVTVIQFMP